MEGDVGERKRKKRRERGKKRGKTKLGMTEGRRGRGVGEG